MHYLTLVLVPPKTEDVVAEVQQLLEPRGPSPRLPR